jgi:endonuclease/exonuclease/phosphatase family metal-dependent hydrolase
MEFSAMTYNIHLGLSSDLETVASILGEADVAAVQEVGYEWIEGESGNQALKLSKLSGLPHFRFAAAVTVRPGSQPPERITAPTAEDRPGLGVALLSRFPLGPWTRHRLPKRQDLQCCILSGTVVTPKGPVSVLVTQLSGHEVDRAAQAAALLRHAQTQTTPLIVLGDLQTTADDPILAPLQAYLTNAGGRDPEPSFPSDGPERAVDHILVSTELTVVSPSTPLPLTGSTHLPVMARLALL